MTNREKKRVYMRDYMKSYRVANRDRINAYQRKWRAENPEKVRAYQEKWLESESSAEV